MGGITNKLGTCLGLLLMLSAGVIFLKFSFSNVINLVFIVVYLYSFIEFKLRVSNYHLTYNHLNGRVIASILLIFTIYLWLLFPIRGSDDRFTFDIVWFIVLLTCLFLEKKVLDKGVRVFANILFWIAVFAIGNYALSLLGIGLPYKEFKVATRETTYYLYPGTVRLHGQDYEIFGLTGFRLAGIFSEPSMFGITCGLVLYSEVFKNQLFRKYTIIVALILSLSTGALLMSLGYIFFVIKRTYLKFLAGGIVVFLLLIGFIYLPSEVIDRFFLDKLSGSIINDRVTGGFDSYFLNFVKSGSVVDLLIGKGADVLSINNFVASDFRGYIIKYGLIGVILLILLIFSFTINGITRVDKFKIFFIFTIIFIHRSWLTLFFVFLFFMFYLSFNNQKDES